MNDPIKILLSLGLLMIITLGYGQDQIELSKNKSQLSIVNNEPQSFKRLGIYGGLIDNVGHFNNPLFNIQLLYAIMPWMALEYDRRFGTRGHANYGRLGVNFTFNPAPEKKLKYYAGVLGAMTRHFYFDIPIGISYHFSERFNAKLGIRSFYMPDDYEPTVSIQAEIMFGIKL